MGEEILKNFTEELVRIWDPLFVIFYFAGFVITAMGIASALKNADPMSGGRGGTLSSGIWSILVGVTLLNMPGFLDAASWTVFRQESMGILEGVKDGNAAWVAYIRFAVAAIQIAGLIAEFRGLIALTDHTGGRGEKLAGLYRIVGGVLAVNFPLFVKMLGNTAGGALGETVNQFF